MPEAPVPSQADRIELLLASIVQKQQEQTAAINSSGQLVQWIVDNVKDIFAFFGSPQMMVMMSGMMPGMMPEPDSPDNAEDDSEDDSASDRPEYQHPDDGPAEPEPAPF
jgi:hypothetical protein